LFCKVISQISLEMRPREYANRFPSREICGFSMNEMKVRSKSVITAQWGTSENNPLNISKIESRITLH